MKQIWRNGLTGVGEIEHDTTPRLGFADGFALFDSTRIQPEFDSGSQSPDLGNRLFGRRVFFIAFLFTIIRRGEYTLSRMIVRRAQDREGVGKVSLPDEEDGVGRVEGVSEGARSIRLFLLAAFRSTSSFDRSLHFAEVLFLLLVATVFLLVTTGHGLFLSFESFLHLDLGGFASRFGLLSDQSSFE